MEDKVKIRIKELCPDVKGFIECPACGIEDVKPITLSVVLRAVKKWHSLDVGENGYEHDAQQILRHWNLLKDNYDDQTEETKQFIGSLLGVV